MPDQHRQTDPDWEKYAGHRARFTQAVLSASATGRERLCVLGAGKCNDLDLDRLAQSFAEIHLVDIDPASVARAVSRHEPPTREKLRPHTPLDLSLLTPKRSSKWQRRPPPPAELEQCRNVALQTVLAKLPGPFDVVVSACVLTQLGFALTQAFHEPHPLLGPLRMNILQLHLQTLLALTAAGGSALFVSDLASSSHYPLDQLPSHAELTGVLADVVAKRAFYHLARPDLVRDMLAQLAPAAEPALLEPWLWTGPLERTYLVYGYRTDKP